ncbi:MAG: hypothetical protein RMJ55_00455 [Roseiflexaceae bacterium]|nr:hypothetical protein [Roseiflexus sp.]MDW8212000.1 hypothetical protein [Roseiflexaceae bacterium]
MAHREPQRRRERRVQAALAASLRFVMRWKQRNHLRDARGTEPRARVIGRSGRAVAYRAPHNPRTTAVLKVGAAATRVTRCDRAWPLGRGRTRLERVCAPWHLLTAEPVAAPAQLRAVIAAYARRWRSALVWRFSTRALAFASSRVWTWEVRQKLLALAPLANALLVHLLHSSCDTLRALALRIEVTAPEDGIREWGRRAIGCAQRSTGSGSRRRCQATMDLCYSG